jgi:hypothetical protein
MATSRTLSKIKKEKKKFIGFIGGYLIDHSALTLEQLDRGLLQQLRLAEQGHLVRLEQVLMDLGYITQPDVIRAMEHFQKDQARLKDIKKK